MEIWTLIKNSKCGNPLLKTLPLKKSHGRRLRRQRRASLTFA
ncbi:hypothetical protein [Emcibacter nanhaiensis]|nr:hypothetical protein [Emcibacter nanhaiensis]